MNENTRTRPRKPPGRRRIIIQAIFWTVMAAAILALLLLPVPQPQATDALVDHKPLTYPVFNFLDLTHAPLDESYRKG
jgi:hypothetical protein